MSGRKARSASAAETPADAWNNKAIRDLQSTKKQLAALLVCSVYNHLAFLHILQACDTVQANATAHATDCAYPAPPEVKIG